MSLFENPEYRYRETFFVLFQAGDRPLARQVEKTLRELNPRYLIADLATDDDGGLESVTVYAPDDYAAMDIVFTSGEELLDELESAGIAPDDRAKFARLPACDARFDVYHFEQMVAGDDEEEEFLDPGTVITVLARLAKLCKGVGVDPQSGTMV